MSEEEPAGKHAATAAGTLWPDIAVRVEAGGILPRWIASSVHPDLGPITGRGVSRDAAIRALVRGIRRRRFVPVLPPHVADASTPDTRSP